MTQENKAPINGKELKFVDYLSRAREFFKGDIYATGLTGIVIDEAAPEQAVCSLKISEEHKNAAGAVMGGAIYTLADFTFAVAGNTAQPHTVTLEGQITYLRPAVCKKLIAKAVCEHSGSKTVSYRIEICDETGVQTASAHFVGVRV